MDEKIPRISNLLPHSSHAPRFHVIPLDNPTSRAHYGEMTRLVRTTLLAALLIAFSDLRHALAQIQTVQVTGGEVQGVVKDGVASFKGIPFAAPPVGELRWKAPQPVKPWSGMRKADAFGPAPMQNRVASMLMGGWSPVSEDCLYLNVWTPATNADEKLPVMVWIYGGGFMIYTGSDIASDATWAHNGQVTVTVVSDKAPSK